MSCSSSDNLLWPGLSSRLLVECFLNIPFRFQDSTHQEQLCLPLTALRMMWWPLRPWPGGLCLYWLLLEWTPMSGSLTQPGLPQLSTIAGSSLSCRFIGWLTGHLQVGCSGLFMRNFCESCPRRTLFGHLVTLYSVLISVVPAYYLWLNKFALFMHFSHKSKYGVSYIMHVACYILHITHIAYCIPVGTIM